MPGDPSWCACPTTEVLQYLQSAEPELVTDTLPTLPPRPVIIGHSGDMEGELSANQQQITLQIQEDGALMNITNNWRVLVISYESTATGDGDSLSGTRKRPGGRHLGMRHLNDKQVLAEAIHTSFRKL